MPASDFVFQKHKVLLALSSLASGLLIAFPALAAPASGETELVFLKHKVPSDAALLARHAPVVVLHPAERAAPTAVDGFLADSDLAGGRYDNRHCSARDGLAALDCYDAADEPAPPPPGRRARLRPRSPSPSSPWSRST